MANNLSFIKMNSTHVTKVYEIEKELISVPWSEKLLKDLVCQDNAVAKVAIIDNVVIGYYSFNIICDEADINNLAIDKIYQRKGYGTALMNDLLLECKYKCLNAVTLEVSSDNKPAIALYEKFGFKVEGIRKGYYNNKLDALIMWKRF